jgi:transcriptional regulator with XRE-family HTH domain
MRPEEIKKLREELDCSLGELARAVGVEVKTLIAWESGDLFPTKSHVDRLRAARQGGPDAVRRSKPPPVPSGLDALSDPRLWAIVTRLVRDAAFFAEVEKLAQR